MLSSGAALVRNDPCLSPVISPNLTWFHTINCVRRCFELFHNTSMGQNSMIQVLTNREGMSWCEDVKCQESAPPTISAEEAAVIIQSHWRKAGHLKSRNFPWNDSTGCIRVMIRKQFLGVCIEFPRWSGQFYGTLFFFGTATRHGLSSIYQMKFGTWDGLEFLFWRLYFYPLWWMVILFFGIYWTTVRNYIFWSFVVHYRKESRHAFHHS